MTEEYHRLGEGRADRWAYGDGQLELLQGVKDSKGCRALNFFLPDAETGEGLSNPTMLYIANELGKNSIAWSASTAPLPIRAIWRFLERVGTPEQKEKWLKPPRRRDPFGLRHDGARRRAVGCEGNPVQRLPRCEEWVINGEKYYISGAGALDARSTSRWFAPTKTPPHKQQSQILVPADTPGVEILGPMHVFGQDDAPHGHMHIRFTDVRASDQHAARRRPWLRDLQLRLGPGRIHHCMRAIGAGERALDLMITRGLARDAFGKKIIYLGKNAEVVSRARIEPEVPPDGASCRQGNGHDGQR
ncbi:MAG: acyl-CoA dehydrogenase family protein [Acidimicrobiales bacterium]